MKAKDDTERFSKKSAKTYIIQAAKAKTEAETIVGLGVELDRHFDMLRVSIAFLIYLEHT